MGTYVTEKSMKYGARKVSTYDDVSHKLLGYCYMDEQGQKHGKEVEYDSKGEVSAEREYENGVCKKSKEYNVPVSSVMDFLQSNSLEGKLFENCKFSPVKEVTKENGQYTHIKIDLNAHLDYDGDVYKRTYDMEFKNGKEYNGYMMFENNYGRPTHKYQYKDGVLDGDIYTQALDGKYTDGKFSGKKYVEINDSPCMDFIKENTWQGSDDGSRLNYDKSKCWQEIKDDKLISDAAVIQMDDVSSWASRAAGSKDVFNVCIPVNGTAIISDSHDFSCKFEVKDGKKNGLYQYQSATVCELAYFKDDKLEGTAINYYDYIGGAKQSEISFKNDELDGAYVEYFAPTKKQRNADSQHNEEPVTGNKKIEGFYKDGQKNGVWKYYSEDGKVINTEFWRDGKNETQKFHALKKVASRHIDDDKPKTKIGQAIQKGVKTIEIAQELAKSKKQRS